MLADVICEGDVMKDVPRPLEPPPIRLAAGRVREDDHRYGHS
jgi:hypothetical protein